MGQESNLHEMNNFNDQAKEHKTKLENEEKIEKAADSGDPKKSETEEGNNYVDENTSEQRMKDMENDGGGFGRNNGSDMSGR